MPDVTPTGRPEGILLASAARVATTSSADVNGAGYRGAVVSADFTATPNDAQTMTVAIQAKDPASGKYTTISTFTALVASALGANPTTATFLFTLYPGAAETVATGNHEVQALVMPSTWRVQMVHSAGGSWTYSLGYSLLS